MTIDELREYRFIIAKIKAIEAEIKSAYNTIGSPIPKDVVAGVSSVRTPSDPTARAFIRIESLREQQQHLVVEADRIEKWVDNLDDLLVSAIIQTHYIAGLSWKQTARKIYGSRSNDDACQMVVKRYFESCR